MPTSYTSLLGLALPVTGELSGTWGDVVNNYLTSYVDASVAGSQTISGSQTSVTLSTTNGSALTQAGGAGTTGSSQYFIINCTGNPASTLTITAPASSKSYIVINSTSTSQSVILRGAGPTTGVTIASGDKALVAWNGSDFVRVGASAGGSNTQVQYNNGGILAGSANMTFDGTKLTVGGVNNTALTASKPVFTDSSKNLVSTGTMPVDQGGTGQTSASAAFNALSPITSTGDLIIGNGTNSATRLAIGSNGTVLTSNGTTASWASATAGDVTAAGNNAFTGANTFYNATGQTFAPASANDGIVLQGRAGGTSSYRVTFATTTLTASRTVTLPNANIDFTTGLGVANGGTGTTSLTANNVLLGNGTSAVQFVAPGTNGNVLTSNGTTWVSQASSSAGGGGTTATGNVTLTSSSSGAQSITTTAYGQWVKLPDATTMTKAAVNFNIKNDGAYPLKIMNSAETVLGFIYPGDISTIGCADNSTAAGSWVCSNAEPLAITAQYSNTSMNNTGVANGGFVTNLDASRTFFQWSLATSGDIYGIVYDASTGTFGSATLIVAAAGNSASIKIDSSNILTGYSRASLVRGRTLTISGTTITVNAEASGTVATSTNSPSFTQIGSTYVMDTRTGSDSGWVVAFTVSGTTVTIGAGVASTGRTAQDGSLKNVPTLFQVNSSTFLRFGITSGTGVYAQAFSISGTTITAGNLTTLTSGNAISRISAYVVGSQWAVVYTGASNFPTVSVITVSGTTTSASTVALGSQALTSAGGLASLASGNKIIVAFNERASQPFQPRFNIATNSSGTVTAGTSISFPYDSGSAGLEYVYMVPIMAEGNIATFMSMAPAAGNTQTYLFNIDYSGSSPVLSSALKMQIGNTSNNMAYNIVSTTISTIGTRANSRYGGTTGRGYSHIYQQEGSFYSFPVASFKAGSVTLSPTSFRPLSDTYSPAFDSNVNFVVTTLAPAIGTGTQIQKVECAQV